MTECPREVRERLNVSRETLERLEIYASLLLRWNTRINLVSSASLKALWRRHMLDSAQLFELANGESGPWADLGSGGGFPGAVVAILADGSAPGPVTLVEADERKAVFLRTVARECGVPMNVVAKRIEACPPIGAQALSARALAPLTVLLGYAKQHLAGGGVCLFPKGAKAMEEVAEARKSWSFDCETIPSMTDENAAILKIRGIDRV